MGRDAATSKRTRSKEGNSVGWGAEGAGVGPSGDAPAGCAWAPTGADSADVIGGRGRAASCCCSSAQIK